MSTQTLDIDANRIVQLLEHHDGDDLQEALHAAIDVYCWHDDPSRIVAVQRGEADEV